MDFNFDEAQQAVSESAAGVFGGLATDASAEEVERTDDRFDERLWAELARANLLGIAVPEDQGGSGLGLTEVCLLLQQQGKTVAPVPLWATLVLGALPIARWGTDRTAIPLAAGCGVGRHKADRRAHRGGSPRGFRASFLGGSRRRKLGGFPGLRSPSHRPISQSACHRPCPLSRRFAARHHRPARRGRDTRARCDDGPPGPSAPTPRRRRRRLCRRVRSAR